MMHGKINFGVKEEISDGKSLIDDLSIKLERIEVVELPEGRVHIRYKVIKQVDTI